MSSEKITTVLFFAFFLCLFISGIIVSVTDFGDETHPRRHEFYTGY